MILLGCLLFLGIILIGLISTSYVQTRIVKQLAQNFTKTTSQQMTFENLKLSWDGRLEFNNFYLEDHHNDTLLYVKVLETSLFDFKNLNKNNFKISELSAKGLFLNLIKYKGETTHSLKILIEKFKKDTINNQKVNFKIDNLNIEHGTFIYKDKIKTESKTVHFS